MMLVIGFFAVFVHGVLKSYVIYSAMFMFHLVGMAHPTGSGLVLGLQYYIVVGDGTAICQRWIPAFAGMTSK